MAEREGFEPPVGFPTTVFKTAAFSRSAISPNNLKLLRGSNIHRKMERAKSAIGFGSKLLAKNESQLTSRE
jgi:hypothetical protein